MPPDRPATFAVDLAVENIGGEPGDYRTGMAAFHVFDLAATKRVFAVCGTSTRVFALHEQLGVGGGGAGEPFYHVVESPYEDFDDDFTRLRACEITLDRSTIDRGLARRRPHGLRGSRHGDPRTRSHRVRDLDDAADPGRSQSLDRRAGHERALAPVPSTRGRRLSRPGRRFPLTEGVAFQHCALHACDSRARGRAARVSRGRGNFYAPAAAGRRESPSPPAYRASSRIGEGLKPLTIR